MRALTQDGIDMFRDWVLALAENPHAKIPSELLTDTHCSYQVVKSRELPAEIFEKKVQLAETLLPHVEELEGLGLSGDAWPGIWDAMSIFYFESICPKSTDGGWKPNRAEHYVYDPGYTVRHRHRIYGPITLFRHGRDNIRPFFAQAPSTLGDFEEQVGSRQELAGNAVALEVLKALYIKNGKNSILSGYTNRKKFDGFKKKLPVPGSLRRFTVIYDQLKRTYDLAGITFDGFVELLPVEFQEWLNA